MWKYVVDNVRFCGAVVVVELKEKILCAMVSRTVSFAKVILDISTNCAI